MKECQQCVFFVGFKQRHSEDAPVGKCRRYPPGGRERYVAEHLIVKADDWCGEFVAVQNQEAQK